MKEAEYYQIQDNEMMKCGLCPHGCNIAPERTGICGVRRNSQGKLKAESYGIVTSIALDPIEKKPLYRFYPGQKILSVGSYGCSFNCGFCQNHQIAKDTGAPESCGYRMMTPEGLADLAMDMAGEDNIGVAYTYNEPSVGIEFVKDCAVRIKEQGQKNVLVSNGFIMERPLMDLLLLIDAMNIDLKGFTKGFYQKIGGDLAAVKRTVKTAGKHCHVEVTTLIIAGENDSPEEMKQLSAWLARLNPEIPLHISRFFPAYRYQGRKPTPVDTVYRLVECAKQNLKYVYPGNC